MLIQFGTTRVPTPLKRPGVDPSVEETPSVVYSFRFSLAATADNLLREQQKVSTRQGTSAVKSILGQLQPRYFGAETAVLAHVLINFDTQPGFQVNDLGLIPLVKNTACCLQLSVQISCHC